MPIMASHEQNDARGVAHLLASTAVDCIRNPQIAPDSEVVLNNVYRLLEAYRVNALFGLESSDKHDPQDATETLTLLPPVERHIKEVRVALRYAITTVFEGRSKDQAILAVEDVLRRVTYPQPDQQPTKEERAKATHFFEQLLQHLNFS